MINTENEHLSQAAKEAVERYNARLAEAQEKASSQAPKQTKPENR